MWTTAITDLRTYLSDSGDDRYNSRKRCFGDVNGTNSLFRTFEFRRVTDFTLSTLPLGVYIDGTILPASGISADFVNTGEFTLTTDNIPEDGSVVEASYYSQWFLDDELTVFLTYAAKWIMGGQDFTQIADELTTAAIQYAASYAYAKMAQRWRTMVSEMYKVEDAPNEAGNARIDSFTKMAAASKKEALATRNDVYNPRQGRALQPLFGSIRGKVRPMPGGTS